VAAPAVTAEEVGQILIYVAPGFFARAAYRYRFPSRRRSDFEALVVSIVLSVPLVALGNAASDLLSVPRDVGELEYVLVVLGLATSIGYLVALTRSTSRVRAWLAAIGMRQAPEHSVSELVFGRLPEDSLIYVNFKDGRALAGNPSSWTFDPEASVRELYVHFPQWWNSEDASWEAADDEGGVLMDLTEIHSVQITADPAQAPSGTRNAG
jgi:hypothetical protein